MTEKEQGYIDGFEAAVKIAEGYTLRIGHEEVDAAIQVGVSSLARLLQNQLDVFKLGVDK